jgi:hypothetical protein
MKILVTLAMAASLLACGGKTRKTATPANKTGTTAAQPEGTGGTTYGGVQVTPAAAGGSETATGE